MAILSWQLERRVAHNLYRQVKNIIDKDEFATYFQLRDALVGYELAHGIKTDGSDRTQDEDGEGS